MLATALAPFVLLLWAVTAGGPPPPAGHQTSPSPPTPPTFSPSPSPSPSSSPVAVDDDARVALDAAAALRATQDLEARLIQLRREFDGVETRQAAWDDMRRSLDDLTARTQELSRRLDQPAAAPAPPPMLPFDSAAAASSFRSRGGGFSLNPTLRLQAGYEGAIVDRGPGQLAAPDRSGFLVRHTELMVEGQILQRRFEYRLLVDFSEPQNVKDAFIQWRASPSLAVRFGQFKLPLGFQRFLRSTYYDFVDLSETMSAFTLERDVGAMVIGRPLAGRLQYQLAVTNGAGEGKRNDNLDLAYTVRVVAAPFGPLPDSEGDLVGQRRPRLSVGVAGYYNLLPTDIATRTNNPAANVDVDGNGRVDNVAVWQGAVELRAHFRGAALQSELFRRLENPGVGGSDRRTGGAYLQASYLVIPHFLGVAVRVDHTDLPLYGAAFLTRQLAGTHVDAQTGAVNAFLRGHALKLQVDYTHLRTSNVTLPGGVYTPDSHRVRASAQLMF